MPRKRAREGSVRCGSDGSGNGENSAAAAVVAASKRARSASDDDDLLRHLDDAFELENANDGGDTCGVGDLRRTCLAGSGGGGGGERGVLSGASGQPATCDGFANCGGGCGGGVRDVPGRGVRGVLGGESDPSVPTCVCGLWTNSGYGVRDAGGVRGLPGVVERGVLSAVSGPSGQAAVACDEFKNYGDGGEVGVRDISDRGGGVGVVLDRASGPCRQAADSALENNGGDSVLGILNGFGDGGGGVGGGGERGVLSGSGSSNNSGQAASCDVGCGGVLRPGTFDVEVAATSTCCDRDEFDIRAIAATATKIVKRRHHAAQGMDAVSSDSFNDIYAAGNDSDVLQHLDAAYELENAIVCSGGSSCDDWEGSSVHHGVRGDDSRSGSNDGARDEYGAQTSRTIALLARTVVTWMHVHSKLLPAARMKESDVSNEAMLDLNSPFRGLTAGGGHRDQNRSYHHDYRQRAKAKGIKTSTRLKPLSDDDRANALKRLQDALGPQGLHECAYVSCDRLVIRCDSVRKEASDWQYMTKMRRSLGGADTKLPQPVQDEYCAPHWVSYLSGVLVSPRSFRCYTNSNGDLGARFNVCKKCNTYIENGSLPKFAISHGFCIGQLPPGFGKLTILERLMTQLVNISAMTRVMRGGRHRCIRSHCIAFDCTPAPPVLLLPRSLPEAASFRVAMVGDFTDAQVEKVKKMHQIRGHHVRELLEFYKCNNCLYSDVTRNDDEMTGIVHEELIQQIILDHISIRSQRHE